MKKSLRDFFSLSVRERRGSLLLVVLLLVVTLVSHFTGRHRSQVVPSADPEWLEEAFRYTPETTPADTNGYGELSASFMPDSAGATTVDPNHASYDALIRAGFGFRTAHNLIRYRQAGGRIRKAGDLMKIYGMDSNQLARVAGHIFVAREETRLYQFPAPAQLDLNRADSASLERLPGIGPVLARRIIRYRNKLGGFSDPEQLAEVYGISDSLLQVLEGRLQADTALVVHISLNKAGEKELASHPYIGKYRAEGILRLRNQVSRIRSPDELAENGVLEKNELEKLRPYLVP